jgi:hypothetical protein
MRKFGLLAAVAGLAIGGSVAQADFVISSTRAQNAFTNGPTSFDIITFTVTNNGLNGTGASTNNIDVAMFDSTGGGKNGMLISATGPAGSPLPNYPDVFANFGETSLPHTSWVNGNLHPTGVTLIQGGASVASMNGSTFTFDQSNNSTDLFANSYTDLQMVAGLGGDMFWTSALNAPNVSGGGVFAQATVIHGDSVTMVIPVSAGRNAPSTTWETGGTSFGQTGSSTIHPNAGGTYTDSLVPEPASIGFLGLAAGGLLARRRRQA